MHGGGPTLREASGGPRSGRERVRAEYHEVFTVKDIIRQSTQEAPGKTDRDGPLVTCARAPSWGRES